MNKKIYILSIVIVTILLSGCGNQATHYGVEAKTVSFDTLEEIEDFSSTIVKIVRENQETPVIETYNDVMIIGYTLSQVKVTEVYKDTSNTLKAGSMITILENEVFNSDENTVYHIAGYNMMEVGKEYLLLLKRNTFENGEIYYVAAGVNYGTVSLENDNRTVQHLSRDGKQVMDFSEMLPYWEAAKKKYKVEK